jgi:hypothetical protein
MKCGLSYKKSVQYAVNFSESLTVFEYFGMIFTHTIHARENLHNLFEIPYICKPDFRLGTESITH